jgi:hypothetical protein
MKLVRLAGLLTVMLLPMVMALPAPAHAQGRTNATCSIVLPAYFSPGFGLTTSTISYGSHGETGSISCVGQINGHTVTRPGSFGFEGTYTGDCLSNVGSGRYSITVPTDAGSLHSTGMFMESRLGASGPVDASQPEGHFSGYHVVAPTRGDCVNSPVTEALVYMVGSLSG